MKKIGIITHYYKSTNYGGNLQAYALCALLNKQKDVCAEQICYDFQQVLPRSIKDKLKGKSLLEIVAAVWRKVCCSSRQKLKTQVQEQRQRAFFDFNGNIIAHSKEKYQNEDIYKCVNDYDAFITGSDQVWNFTWYNPAFFLDFVPSEKTKISYAASIALSSLTDEQKAIVKKSLKDYKAVSVREKSAVELLDGLSPVPVQTTLDPTLLLSADDWDKVCAEKKTDGEYIFCYFLGENKKSRQITEKFAQKRGLKIIAIPYVGGVINATERKFGDERRIDVSPQRFLSLIKHAKYVFTDSFHAVVFSNIYKKQYFVFNRNQKGAMSTRITDITELFGQTERFCAGKERESFAYVESLGEIDYTKSNAEFARLKEQSIAFLRENLEL